MNPSLRVEFHCHTLYSKDSLTSLDVLLETCRKKGIDRVVVTDHNRITGALRAQEMDPERVIVGEEIMTQKGELLAAYVREEVPKGLPPLEAIQRLREQGAFISVSHPYDYQRGGAWKENDLLEIAPLVDAIETFNARCLEAHTNELAAAFAREHNLPGTAGSDAHASFELGAANLLVPAFDGPESLKAALWQAKPLARLSPAWVHFWSTYCKLYKRVTNFKI
jgi:predicted metal-dependent phosphoesterase TrpH